MTRFDDLKKLDKKTRNQIRAMLSSGADGFTKISKFRKTLKTSKHVQIDKVLSYRNSAFLVGDAPFFPDKPPFNDRIPTPIEKNLESVVFELNRAVMLHGEKLSECIKSLTQCNRAIVDDTHENAAKLLKDHTKKYGWSHAVLRKLVLLRSINSDEINCIESMLWHAGLHKNNIVITSLIHCFAGEQNYLSSKQAVMNFPDRGISNRTTRLLARLPYQPIGVDANDASLLIQTALNTSLLDGLILAKINRHLISENLSPHLKQAMDSLESCISIEDATTIYDTIDFETEDLFLKQNSAWLELEAVRQYRFLVDNFYDASEASYIAVSEACIKEISSHITPPSQQSLALTGTLVIHQWRQLKSIQHAGAITRSATFNYWLYITNGEITFDGEILLTLMASTRDLSRTIPIVAARNIALISKDRLTKLTMLLLLAKRSKNERDEHRLRQILQAIVLEEHEGSLVEFVRKLNQHHSVIADYIYDLATEDFIARLTKITRGIFEITNTRAALHNWKAEITGSNYYSDRARAILIDHQLNRIRDEIDDNRIYVDASRFSSWINDEVMLELSSALTVSKVKNKTISTIDETVLSHVVEKCYSAFCTNAIFGITSYLGRRIRHGTFKGQLFSGLVKQLETKIKYSSLFRDQQFLISWNKWKNDYKLLIESVIVDRLHIESREKPNGFLRPHLSDMSKQEIQAAAVKVIIQVYEATRSTDNFDVVLTEYCWRLLDVDLRNIKAELKSLHRKSKQLESLTLLPSYSLAKNSNLARSLTRELIISIDSRMMAMHTWFQKPLNVSPRAALSLLYAAVIAEVKDEYPEFNPEFKPEDPVEIEIIGGAYHIVYDCLYVILYNAAKHGNGSVRAIFKPVRNENEKKISFELSSPISTFDFPHIVAERLKAAQASDLNTAHLRDHRSGISKLRQLEQNCGELKIDLIGVREREVVVAFSLNLLSMT